MAASPLQTYGRRTSRLYVRRRRSRRIWLLVAAAALSVAGFAGWRLAEAHDPAGPSPAAASQPSASAVATVAAAASRPATPEASATTVTVATAAPEPSRPATITIAAFGDMIFDRQVKALISAQGGSAPLAEVAPALAKADVAVGNLESVLSDKGAAIEKDVTFRGDPRAIAGLTDAGIDIVSLANNHVLDYGPDALADSIARLDDAGIAHAGAGADKAAAWRPASIERDGAKVAYLAFSHIIPPGFIAQDDRAGFASGRMDMSLVEDAIRRAKKDHDYVLVSFHWGVEYEDLANQTQVANAHRAIDAGADMVLAHHPHVIQGVEFYKDGLIAYSLGDFVFDHYSRKTGEAFILNAELGPDGVTGVEAVPVYLDRYGRPEYVTGGEARTILERLRRISAPHGTNVTIDGDTARIRP